MLCWRTVAKDRKDSTQASKLWIWFADIEDEESLCLHVFLQTKKDYSGQLALSWNFHSTVKSSTPSTDHMWKTDYMLVFGYIWEQSVKTGKKPTIC